MIEAARVPMSTLLLNANAAHRHVQALEASLAKSRELLSGHESALRDAIAGGAETGDKMFDIALRVRGYDPELADKFRELDAELKSKTGEFVLVTFETKFMTTHRQIGKCDFENRTMFRIAILTGDTLIWNEKGLDGYVTVPTKRYTTGEVATIFSKPVPRPAVSDGDLFACAYIDDPKPLGMLVLEDRWRAHLFIGDDAVRAFLAEKRMLPLFRTAAEALGRLVLQPLD